MDDLEVGTVYAIQLCSGERRRWQYLGLDGRGLPRWRDCETRLEFGEGSLMYAWTLLGAADADWTAG
ncbi:hypothetical protein [Azonexus sp.]|uniref:hypothetical protein n=1 Tax=Azonexus sp. TaxID=1872668 RepID=UPI0035B0922D